ncbi:MAG: Endoribonuclease YbeY [Candidatus Latescibacteria bacterium ADurb.Bin168]|nr:MAG: Endoribonuclease YbeY [Candidatus Latescibacteria bacterium ADurb.Bin168]
MRASHQPQVHIKLLVDAPAKPHLRGMRRGWKGALGKMADEVWKRERGNIPASVAIVFVGPERMRELNRSFRGKDAVTDVLTFDLADSVDSVEGEIYVCPEFAAGQLGTYGTDLHQQVVRLVLHGVLHLAGHDHHTLADGKRMADLTRRYLREFVW